MPKFAIQYRYTLPLLMLLGLSACSLLERSKEECQRINWQQVGQRDGQHGINNFAEIAEECQPHGVIPDQQSYMRGWQQGIVNYCTPDNGMAEGRRGTAYKGQCPKPTEAVFLQQHRLGYEINHTKKAIQQIDEKIDHYQARLKDKNTKEDSAIILRRELREQRDEREIKLRILSELETKATLQKLN